MTVIYKYPIDPMPTHHFRLNAPIIKPLKIDYKDGVPCLWAIVDTNKEPETWVVTKLGTGWDFEFINHTSLTLDAIDPDSYLSTTFEPGTPYVWHWFCRPLIQSMDL